MKRFFEEGDTPATSPVSEIQLTLPSEAGRRSESGPIRGFDAARDIAAQLGRRVRTIDARAIHLHDALDPRRVFELLQPE